MTRVPILPAMSVAFACGLVGCVVTGPVQPGAQRVGRVEVVQSEGRIATLPSWDATLSADFFRDACHYQPVGLCLLSSCSSGGASDGGVVDAGGPADPGPIRVSVPGTMLTLMPTGDGSYFTAHAGGGSSEVFGAGAALQVQAAGGILPGFTVTVAVPGTATVLSPSSFPEPVDRGANLNVSWSGLAGDTAEVDLWVGDELQPTAVLRCAFPGAAGSNTIPQAALALLPSGPGGMQLRSLNSANLTDGDTPVTVTTATLALDSSGAIYDQPLTLQ